MPRPLEAVRKISDAESAVLERALIVAATDDASVALSEQARTVQVIGRCSCGCASVDFLTPAKGQVARIVADAHATAPNGEYVGVLVWAIDSELSGLEFYSYSDNPAPIPVLASITVDGMAGTQDAV